MSKFCPSCGKTLYVNEKYCMNCGFKSNEKIVVVKNFREFLEEKKKYKSKKSIKKSIPFLIIWFLVWLSVRSYILFILGYSVKNSLVSNLINFLILVSSLLMYMAFYNWRYKNKSYILPSDTVKYINPYVDTRLFQQNVKNITVDYKKLTLNYDEKILYAVSVGIYKGTEIKDINDVVFGDYVVTTDRLCFVAESKSIEDFEVKLCDVLAVHSVAKNILRVKSTLYEKDIFLPESEMVYAVSISQSAVYGNINKDII